MSGPKYTILEVLQNEWWIGVLALFVSLIATPIVRLIAYRAKVTDRPDDLLKPHGRPVAYLGGVAICLGLLAGLAGYALTMPNASEGWQALKSSISSGELIKLLQNSLWNIMSIALACIVITVVGLLDDIRNIQPKHKVMGQVTAAMILLAGGIGYRMSAVLFTVPGLSAPPTWILVPLSVPMCVMLVIATCNATNLLDGLDGLCGGVTGIIAIGFLCLAVFLAMWGEPGRASVDHLRVGLCLAMAGAVLGFLPYNIPPASIFMGDAGSMLLGFFVATVMALFCQEGNVRWFIAACAVFALPILDTALAVVRRVLSGKGIFTGDRSHLYDQLVDRGMTVKRVVVLFYFLAAIAAAIGVGAAIFLRVRWAVALYAVLLVAIWLVFYKLGMITPPPRGSSQSGGSHKAQEQ